MQLLQPCVSVWKLPHPGVSCVWMGKVKTKWNDTGGVTCVKCVSCTLYHMQGLGLDIPSSLCSWYQRFSSNFTSCLDNCRVFLTNFFLNTFLYIQCYLEKNLFLNSNEALLSTFFVSTVWPESYRSWLSILVPWIPTFIKAWTRVLGFYIKLWGRKCRTLVQELNPWKGTVWASPCPLKSSWPLFDWGL